MAETVASLLRRSLEYLESEVPDSYRHLVAELGRLVIEVEVDGELFSVRGGRRLEVVEGVASRRGGARVTTSRAAIVAVLDADVALPEAVQSGRVDVRGPLDDVVRAYDTLMAYAHAAVRAPSMPGLLVVLRDASGGAR